jgi:hypothetical protein
MKKRVVTWSNKKKVSNPLRQNQKLLYKSSYMDKMHDGVLLRQILTVKKSAEASSTHHHLPHHDKNIATFQ